MIILLIASIALRVRYSTEPKFQWKKYCGHCSRNRVFLWYRERDEYIGS